MAIMHPRKPDFRRKPYSEEVFFRRLRESLSDEFHVYYSTNYLGLAEPVEGEADFLVVHPKLGLLVIECKGKGIVYEGGVWWRGTPGAFDADKLRETPFEQAQRHVKTLVKRFDARAAIVDGFRSLPLTHGHAVAFPLTSTDEVALPLDANRTIVLDSDDLMDLERRVVEAMQWWAKAYGGRKPALSVDQFDRILTQVIQPHIAFVPNFGGTLALEDLDLIELDKRQALVIRGLLQNRRFSVSGCPGTGKTILAVEAARTLAVNEGLDVLLLCFNRALGEHLARRAEELETGEGSVTALRFHQICMDAYRWLDRRAVIPNERDAQTAFWHDEAPTTLLEALLEGHGPRYDAIIVDEAQDLRADWWDCVFQQLRDPAEGRIVAFYDADQSLFRVRGCQVPTDRLPTTYRLQYNYRNTKAIVDALRELANTDVQAHPDALEGDPPSVRDQPSPRKTVRKLEELVAGYLRENVSPRRMAVLTPHRRHHSALAGVDSIAGLPLLDEPPPSDDGLLHATIGRFKGLEADIVFLLDVDPKDERCDVAARYVAASRARRRLYVFQRGNWLERGQHGEI